MPSALVFYQYLYPDDVVSSIHISELCAGLAASGWEVTAVPCNRGCRDESRTYTSRMTWKGVHIERVWRPPARQASSFGRLFNAVWMIARWSAHALFVWPKPDVVIVGTDPIFSVLTAIVWKRIRRTPVAHWCFDLYPEAAVAGGIANPNSLLIRVLSRALRLAYQSCDMIVDLGTCMSQRLENYAPAARKMTVIPWALIEPLSPLRTDLAERKSLFSEARLALLYSGNYGLAHQSECTLALARRLRGSGLRLVFSVRGNRAAALQVSVDAQDTNIGFVPFADQSQLQARLSCADVHVVSLRPSWTGTVVPSKFFGALAAGRPVLFEGAEDCSIAKWIREFGVGWVLNRESIDEVAADLLESFSSPERVADLRRRCHALYQERFSRAHGIEKWHEALCSLAEFRVSPLPVEGALCERPFVVDSRDSGGPRSASAAARSLKK